MLWLVLEALCCSAKHFPGCLREGAEATSHPAGDAPLCRAPLFSLIRSSALISSPCLLPRAVHGGQATPPRLLLMSLCVRSVTASPSPPAADCTNPRWHTELLALEASPAGWQKAGDVGQQGGSGEQGMGCGQCLITRAVGWEGTWRGHRVVAASPAPQRGARRSGWEGNMGAHPAPVHVGERFPSSSPPLCRVPLLCGRFWHWWQVAGRLIPGGIWESVHAVTKTFTPLLGDPQAASPWQ